MTAKRIDIGSLNSQICSTSMNSFKMNKMITPDTQEGSLKKINTTF